MEKLPYIVVVVDGIIGSGKSTIIAKCLVPILSGKGMRITVIDEPVEKWKSTGRLKQFYEDPNRRAYQFQTIAFHDRVKLAQEKFRKFKDCTDVFLMERSIFSDLIFTKILLANGSMDQTEYDDYMNLWTMWEDLMPFQPDLFVYLNPGVDVAMQRIQERSRDGESGITLDYQQRLHDRHEEFLGSGCVEISNSHYVPCYHICTADNFRDVQEVKLRIAEEFENKVNELRRSKVR